MEKVAQQFFIAQESNGAQTEQAIASEAPQVLSLFELEQVGGGSGPETELPGKGW